MRRGVCGSVGVVLSWCGFVRQTHAARLGARSQARRTQPGSAHAARLGARARVQLPRREKREEGWEKKGERERVEWREEREERRGWRQRGKRQASRD